MIPSEPITAAFAKANGIEACRRVDDTLFVEAQRPLDRDAIRALEFVAGGKLVVSIVDPGLMDGQRSRSVANWGAQGQPMQAPVDPGVAPKSLVDRLLEPVLQARTFDEGIRVVARLLESGHPARSLGLQPGSGTVSSARLADGSGAASPEGLSLAEWAASLPAIPEWMQACLSACHDEESQAAALRAFVTLAERERHWRRSVRVRAISTLFAWPALVLAWMTLAWPVGIAFGAVGAMFALRFRQLEGRSPQDDMVRAQVLRIVAMQSRLGLPPVQALRIAALRMKDIEPTWGEPPETREGLVRMLRLDAVDRVVLLSGDLPVAALRLARECERRAGAALAGMSLAAMSALGVLLVATAIGILA